MKRILTASALVLLLTGASSASANKTASLASRHSKKSTKTALKKQAKGHTRTKKATTSLSQSPSTVQGKGIQRVKIVSPKEQLNREIPLGWNPANKKLSYATVSQQLMPQLRAHALRLGVELSPGQYGTNIRGPRDAVHAFEKILSTPKFAGLRLPGSTFTSKVDPGQTQIVPLKIALTGVAFPIRETHGPQPGAIPGKAVNQLKQLAAKHKLLATQQSLFFEVTGPPAQVSNFQKEAKRLLKNL